MAESIYGAGVAPFAIAHRGGAGLAAENTLDAFGRSYAPGVGYLETDVRVTADGARVAFHDAALRRVIGRRGVVRGVTRRELASFGVPTLDEVLVAFPDACLTIDVKEGSAGAPLAGDVGGAPGVRGLGRMASQRAPRGRPHAHRSARLAGTVDARSRRTGRDAWRPGEPLRHDHLRIPHFRRWAIRG